MLKLAHLYIEKLNKIYKEVVVFNDRYKYYNDSGYWNFDMSIAADSWNQIEMVSVDKDDNVIGFLRAKINRDSRVISNLGIMSFKEELNIVFSRDMRQFITDLFTKFNYRKIEFAVVIGNPIEKMYDRYIQRYGGRIIGIVRQTTVLQDGKYHDVKLYEIFREDYIMNNKFKE